MASPKKKNFGTAHEEYGKEQEGQPFGQYEDEIFAALDAGKVDSDNLPIMSIWADKTQPRNIIPREIHGGWTGSPAAMPDILGAWIEALYDAGFVGDIEEILLGKQGSDKTNSLTLEGQDPLVQKFLSILTLAAQIRDVGLRQRIGVIETGKKEYRIIFGERRWTAFHLLKMFLGDGYANIPAQIAKVSEWELAKIQAAENFHQNPLNAIGKARQLAKLLILARKDTQDPPYDSWDMLVVEGGCNRPYFAQVADGKIHRIPKGMGEEFERTLNISVEQMGQYRALLRLTGDYEIDNRLWDMGDERDWAEGFMRSIGDLGLPVIRQIFEEAKDPEEMLREAVSAARSEKKMQNIPTIVGISDGDTPEEAAPKSPFGPAVAASTGMGQSTSAEPDFKYGDEVMTKDGKGTIITIQGDTALVRLDADRRSVRYGMRNLQAAPKVTSWFGRYVQNPTGGEAEVIADLGEFCELLYADGGRGNLHKMYLSQISKEEFDAAWERHKAANAGTKRYLYVRGAQGIARVMRNIDTSSFILQFPDGEEFEADKTGWISATEAEWNTAVAALEAAGEDEDEQEEDEAAPDFKFKVGERVLVRIGMGQAGGTVVAIRPEQKQPYTVKLDNGNVSNYTVWMLDVAGNQSSASEELIQIGDEVLVSYNGREFAGTVRYIEGTGEKPYGVHNNETRSTHYYSRDALTLRKKGGGSDNANSLSPDAPAASPDEIKPRDWVGKPALIKEDGYKVAVFVQEFLGAGMLKVATNAGQIREVHFSQLEAVASDKTTLSEFFSNDEGLDHSDLLGRRVSLNNGETGRVTSVIGNSLSIQYTEFMSGGASVGDIVEVLEDDEAEETKAITDVDAQRLLRHIAHITRRETTILKLLALTRQKALQAYKDEKLVPDLQLIRDSIKSGFDELLEEVGDILEAIITEAEESTI